MITRDWRVILLLIVTMLVTGYLWSMPTPKQQEHPREKPTTFCYHTAPKGKTPCKCVDQDKAAGCKHGKREVEVNSCSSFCWMAMCNCCKS